MCVYVCVERETETLCHVQSSYFTYIILFNPKGITLYLASREKEEKNRHT
jgi:hypothetical protein